MEPPTERALHAEPVDLEIQVTTPWGGGAQRVEYLLDSPSGRVDFHKERVAGPTIRAPDAFQAKLFEQLEALQQRRDVDGDLVLDAEMERELLTLGHGLYQDLFPRDLQRIYREIRGRVETLVVTSDEPWIPWEMVRPHEGDDDDFLCMRFRMTRWLSGSQAMAPGKSVKHLLGVRAGEDLPATEQELALLHRLASEHSDIDARLMSAGTFQDVIGEIESGVYDLLHFAGHGEHDAARPGESKLHLEDRVLRARQLTPQAQARLKARRPVVFFNSCQVGRGGSALTQLDGWAVTWVTRCGCTAFVAPLWSIEDASAVRFAEVFYHQLASGRTLGEAVHTARHTLRAERPDGLGWLAYSVYGNPNARIAFDGVEGMEPPPRPRPNPSPRDPSSPRPIPTKTRRRPRRQPPKGPRILGGAVALSLVLLLAGWLVFGPSPAPEVASPEVVSPPGATDPSDKTPTADDPVVEEPPPPPPPAPPSGPPLQALVPGRVGVVVVDGSSRADAAVARAVESVLFKSGVTPLLVTPGRTAAAVALSRGGLADLPSDGRTPWGAESLLVATVDRQPLPQNNPSLSGVRMSMRTKLLDLRARAVERAVSETHTGMGPTESDALEQAAERCLGDLLPLLP